MRFLLTAALVSAVAGSGCHRDSSPPPAVGPRREPQTESECRACNGEWGPHGIRQVSSCLCRTGDAGKLCKDGSDCEGECEAEEGKTEVVDPGPPARGYFLGRCSAFTHLFGCHKLLPDGTKAKGPVPLDQPLTAWCVD